MGGIKHAALLMRNASLYRSVHGWNVRLPCCCGSVALSKPNVPQPPPASSAPVVFFARKPTLFSSSLVRLYINNVPGMKSKANVDNPDGACRYGEIKFAAPFQLRSPTPSLFRFPKS
jgi:hypothetical protein